MPVRRRQLPAQFEGRRERDRITLPWDGIESQQGDDMVWQRVGALALAGLLLVVAPGAAPSSTASETTERGSADADSTVRNRARFVIAQDVALYRYSVVVDQARIGGAANPVDAALGVEFGDHALETGWRKHGRVITTRRVSLGRGVTGTGTYRAIPGTSALQALIQLRNVRKTAVSRDFDFAGSLEWGENTHIDDTSSGDLRFNRDDRWFVASAPDDPAYAAVAEVFAGPRASARVTGAFVSSSADGGTLARLDVRLPRRSTRYMLAYLVVDRTPGGAARAMSMFRGARPSARMLRGISPAVQRKVLNWDLG